MENTTATSEDVREAKAYAFNLQQRAMDQAHREGRALTASELTTIQRASDEAIALERRVGAGQSERNFLDAFDKSTKGMTRDDRREVRGNGIGAAFVRSEAGQWLQHTKRGPHWSSPTVELDDPRDMYNTLITSSGSGDPLVVPHYVPGISAVTPTPEPVVADLLSVNPTTSNLITYLVESSFTNAAAAVAEGAAKPESAFVYTQTQEPVVKIAHFVPVTEELLDDVPSFAAYLDLRLVRGVRVVENDQLLNGSGVAPALKGILTRAGLAPPVARVDPQTNVDALATQIANIRTATNVQPTGIVMHPSNWLTTRLMKATTNEYLGSGPFQPEQTQSLWGLAVALTPSIAAGTALIVSREVGIIFRRSGIMVSVSNSHQDYFAKNLVAVRAESRLALAITLPAAFGTVTGLT
jgi:HK97 family phage major capsid protein